MKTLIISQAKADVMPDLITKFIRHGWAVVLR